MRILGIDPGTRLTGFGCVERGSSRSLKHVNHGVIRLVKKSGLVDSMELRLKTLHEVLTNLVRDLKPDHFVVEKIFFAKNAVSALKLGQARGVILLVAAQNSIPIWEYSVTEVKRAISGFGRTDKESVARSIEWLLKEKLEFPTLDASDALALALTHGLVCQETWRLSKTL